ncbi:MAG: hypothetical protein IT247_02330 [Bacteroidia bacterium]|nr:hypothetical protein [Bacteroidia bacterium]
MDILDDDILNLWKALTKHKVAYIMVGGFATNMHGFSRITADLDIWIKDTPENRKNFRAALKDAKMGDLKEIETTVFVPGWSSLYLSSGMELDIMTSLKGFPEERFEECYALAPVAEIHDIPVRFLHLNHLLEAKKATARPKDLLDIEELNKINKP